MWEIVFEEEVGRQLAYFLEKNKNRVDEVERMLAELKNYPRVRWVRLFGDPEGSRFVSDSGQRLRFAGKASFSRRKIVITHFSYHD